LNLSFGRRYRTGRRTGRRLDGGGGGVGGGGGGGVGGVVVVGGGRLGLGFVLGRRAEASVAFASSSSSSAASSSSAGRLGGGLVGAGGDFPLGAALVVGRVALSPVPDFANRRSLISARFLVTGKSSLNHHGLKRITEESRDCAVLPFSSFRETLKCVLKPCELDSQHSNCQLLSFDAI